MEDPSAHRLEERSLSLEHRRVAADDDRDVARRGEVHAAGDRRLKRCDPALARQRRQPQELVAVVRAHVDPRGAVRQCREHTVTGFDDVCDDSGRRKTRDHRVGCAGGVCGRPRALGTRRDKTTNGLVVTIVDDDVEPGVHEARREVPTQAPDADEADPHQPTTVRGR